MHIPKIAIKSYRKKPEYLSINILFNPIGATDPKQSDYKFGCDPSSTFTLLYFYPALVWCRRFSNSATK
jgi:hypothetical protein